LTISICNSVRATTFIVALASFVPLSARGQYVSCVDQSKQYDAENNDLGKKVQFCTKGTFSPGGGGEDGEGSGQNADEAAAENWYCTALKNSLFAKCQAYPPGKTKNACIAAANKQTKNNCKGPNPYPPGEGNLTPPPTPASASTPTPTPAQSDAVADKSVRSTTPSCTQYFRVNYRYCGTIKNSRVQAECRSLTGSTFQSCNETQFKSNLAAVHP
jgi:hypothetical protein